MLKKKLRTWGNHTESREFYLDRSVSTLFLFAVLVLIQALKQKHIFCHFSEATNDLCWTLFVGFLVSLSLHYRCLQADSWRVVSASDDRTLKVTDPLQSQIRISFVRLHIYFEFLFGLRKSSWPHNENDKHQKMDMNGRFQQITPEIEHKFLKRTTCEREGDLEG